MIKYFTYLISEDLSKKLSTVLPESWQKQSICPKEPCFIFTQCENVKDIKNLWGYKNLHPNITYIILSSNKDIVYDCFEIEIFDFIRIDHFSKDIKRVIEHIQSTNMVFKFKNANITLSCITYIESFAHTVTIHTVSATIRQAGSISKLEKQLTAYGFIRIHRFYLINKKHLSHIQNNEILLNDNTSLPIGKTYQTKIRAAF